VRALPLFSSLSFFRTFPLTPLSFPPSHQRLTRSWGGDREILGTSPLFPFLLLPRLPPVFLFLAALLRQHITPGRRSSTSISFPLLPPPPFLPLPFFLFDLFLLSPAPGAERDASGAGSLGTSNFLPFLPPPSFLFSSFSSS